MPSEHASSPPPIVLDITALDTTALDGSALDISTRWQIAALFRLLLNGLRRCIECWLLILTLISSYFLLWLLGHFGGERKWPA